MRELVIVGNGMVGQRLAELVTGWRVTVLGEEPHPAYDRVHLSDYLAGRTAAQLSLVPAGCYDGPDRTLWTDTAVSTVDRRTRTVRCGRREFRYDALVLATGSVPFVPPVPGADGPRCFVYRTLTDLDAIRAAAAGARTGVVVGGGLLGLEAANALRALGLRTHVVELAARPMPAQLDEGGGEALRRRVTALGLELHLATALRRVEHTPATTRLHLTTPTPTRTGDQRRETPGFRPEVGVDHEGEAVLEADLVVFSAGVRPRDELAREAGLAVGPRGGVLVDRACRTADPDVYAIGECAAVDGTCYGLVAPGYAMAEVVADRLAGGAATLSTVDTSTELKVLGVDVASFGDAHGSADGALQVVYADLVGAVYKKLVVSDDARTLLGGMLVGDAAAYPTLRALVGTPLPAPPEDLLFPGGRLAELTLPDTAQVCTCHAVSKGSVLDAIREHGLTDIPSVQECTRAGTGCGSCVPLLKGLLAEAGVAVGRGLCEHFGQTRAELFEIVRVTGIGTFSELVARHGTGRGCDICKPVVASVLASLHTGEHVLGGERATLQDTNDHFLANLQKDGSYSVVPRVPAGEITAEKLIAIGEVARDFDLYTKITGGQRIDLLGARVEQLPLIWRRLVDAGFESGHAYGKAVRTVKSCVGSTWCRYGVQDSVRLAIELELRYRGLRAPHKIKLGVSGCARECAEAQAKDVGVIATETGWALYVGGNGGFRPRHARLFLSDVDTATLVRTIDRFLMFYVRTADRLQRTAPWLEQLDGGLDHLRRVIVDDELGICADLDAAMARHVADYTDEWRAALDDPDTLRRFVSFVNAPDQPDPGIAFVRERGQIRPARGTPGAVLVAGPTLPVGAP
jgi:nitrite reductase (NADH) large subunit